MSTAARRGKAQVVPVGGWDHSLAAIGKGCGRSFGAGRLIGNHLIDCQGHQHHYPFACRGQGHHFETSRQGSHHWFGNSLPYPL